MPVYSAPRTPRTRKKAATAISTALRLVPRRRAESRVRWSVDSPVRTKKVPIMEARMPKAAMIIGRAIAFSSPLKAATPRAEAEMMEPT